MKPEEIRWAGDRARLLLCDSLATVLALNAVLRDTPLPGQIDLVPAAATLLVGFATPRQARLAGPTLAGLDAPPVDARAGREITIDVVYDGEDLADVAAHTGLSTDQIVAAHTAQPWQAAFGGFAPGFFYMTGGDERLAVPRRESPRTRVPAGAVGLAGPFSAVYPKASPGGWQLIGRTDAQLWDISRAQPALLQPGDRVRYRAVDTLAAEPGVAPEITAAAETKDGPALEILSPGLQSLIQDMGRPGQAHIGVSASGAADQTSARQANRLVGNALQAAVIETVAAGLRVRARGDTVLALSSAAAPGTIDGINGTRAAPPGTAFALHAGETLTLAAPTAGLRTYLGVRGGFDIAPTLGSRATDTLAGLGPAALTTGTEVPIASPRPGQAVGHPEPMRQPAGNGSVELTVIAGPRDDWFDTASRARLTDTVWQVSAASDRIGLRLQPAETDAAADTPVLKRATQAELPSEGCVPGALQVPPDGAPILFLRDHPVTGGYPVIAVLASCDIDRAAQLAPGDTLRFRLAAPAPPVSTRPEDQRP